MKKRRIILIILSVLILLGCIGMTAYLLFSNYQNVRLFKEAQSNFSQGDEASLTLAETQLLQVIRNDSDNEAAFIMLGEIARKRKIHPEQVYYCFMAYRLNPLSSENKEKYIESLCFARYFDRLENFLAQESSLSDRQLQLLLYAAGRNGNISKYKTQPDSRNNDNRLGELALLLFKHSHLSDKQKLAAIEGFRSDDDLFLQQEVLVAQTDFYIATGEIDRAEECLRRACELNRYAFAPALGRFYSNYRNFGKALEIFEQHLSVYHDPSVAMQAAEIYCLLKQTGKIGELRARYQSDTGNRAMLCNYYFDALTALAQGDWNALKELTVPLRGNINTPLSAFMFFCADIQTGDIAALQSSYNNLQSRQSYLDLQKQADDILSNFLKNTFASGKTPWQKLIPPAILLYKRKPELFTAKLILLAQKRSNSINPVILKDALKRFGNDPGVIKLAIEYYLKHELPEAEHLITLYKQKFAASAADMLRYEINLYMQKKDHEKISALFRANFKPEILPEYWAFASTTMREEDLLFLSGNKLYGPFCEALLMIKKGDLSKGCELLKNADAGNNPALLFFSAKILAENGHHQSALDKYALFPPQSPYHLAVLLNTAELHAETGKLTQALTLARQAYNTAPDLPETRLCYADKLFRNGMMTQIPDIVKLSTAGPYRRKMEKLWIAGMQSRLQECDINSQQEKIREICRQILVVDPANSVVHELLKKLNKMPQ